MKKGITFIMVLLLAFISACSEDEVTPNERFNTYVEQWNEQNFTEMYDLLSPATLEAYQSEDFIERYEKIYTDLEVSNLEVTYEALSEEETETAMEEGSAIIPFSVQMDTLAEPIVFDYEATLTQVGEEEEKNWFVHWDRGFIFPELKDGGEINFQTQSPERGDILDRNQLALAINDSVWEIGIVPGKLTNPEQAKQQIADLLKMSVDTIDAKLSAEWVEPDLFVPLSKVPKTNEDVLNQLWEIDGIKGNNVTGRVYPYNEATGHLVGYVGQITAEELEEKEPGTYGGNDIIGKRGLEQLYEEQLKGERGIKITIEKEGEDDVILTEKPVQDGEDILVTIDADLQKEIYESYDGQAGTTAAIDPKTGETLALVSSPAFDPNQIVYSMSSDDWDEMQNDPQAPLLNRFSATYAPGSTFKPVTAQIGLNNGTIVPGETVEIEGLTWDNGEGWGNYQVRRVSESSGPVDITDALIRSDNIYFAMQAIDMGGDALVNGLEEFGFNEELPYEYPMEISTISTEGTLDNEVLLADTSYGQGQVQMSALHLALSYTPILNQGNLISPTLLTSEETSQIWKNELISSEHATLIQETLRDVVVSSKGTAPQAQDSDFPISGKTGTAELKQTSDEEDGKENGWFVGYPTDDQDILIAMMVEEAQGSGGSSIAVEKVTNILKKIK
ncbi:penicillin-binding transpeptidase domain-containing protein [Virgibacillus byunsanensis]|uniref:serine-type D-Ala-D-Ala carboxypeptidase n=1 Tax=Virgibacillus byunsanensis TaxID=570945 RepID=A0ABW3LSU4_9BACI